MEVETESFEQGGDKSVKEGGTKGMQEGQDNRTKDDPTHNKPPLRETPANPMTNSIDLNQPPT